MNIRFLSLKARTFLLSARIAKKFGRNSVKEKKTEFNVRSKWDVARR